MCVYPVSTEGDSRCLCHARLSQEFADIFVYLVSTVHRYLGLYGSHVYLVARKAVFPRLLGDELMPQHLRRVVLRIRGPGPSRAQNVHFDRGGLEWDWRPKSGRAVPEGTDQKTSKQLLATTVPTTTAAAAKAGAAAAAGSSTSRSTSSNTISRDDPSISCRLLAPKTASSKSKYGPPSKTSRSSVSQHEDEQTAKPAPSHLRCIPYWNPVSWFCPCIYLHYP